MIDRFILHIWKTLLSDVISKVNIAFLICIADTLHMIHFILHFFVKNSYGRRLFLVSHAFKGLHLWFVKIITN